MTHVESSSSADWILSLKTIQKNGETKELSAWKNDMTVRSNNVHPSNMTGNRYTRFRNVLTPVNKTDRFEQVTVNAICSWSVWSSCRDFLQDWTLQKHSQVCLVSHWTIFELHRCTLWVIEHAWVRATSSCVCSIVNGCRQIVSQLQTKQLL